MIDINDVRKHASKLERRLEGQIDSLFRFFEDNNKFVNEYIIEYEFSCKRVLEGYKSSFKERIDNPALDKADEETLKNEYLLLEESLKHMTEDIASMKESFEKEVVLQKKLESFYSTAQYFSDALKKQMNMCDSLVREFEADKQSPSLAVFGVKYGKTEKLNMFIDENIKQYNSFKEKYNQSRDKIEDLQEKVRDIEDSTDRDDVDKKLDEYTDLIKDYAKQNSESVGEMAESVKLLLKDIKKLIGKKSHPIPEGEDHAEGLLTRYLAMSKKEKKMFLKDPGALAKKQQEDIIKKLKEIKIPTQKP